MDMKGTIRLKLIAIVMACCGTAQAAEETFPCLIEASSEVEIGSPVTGVIGQIMVERSDTVRKGQIVARLRSSVERRSVELAALRADDDAEIEAAKAALAHAQREKARAVKLYKKQLVSRQFLDKAITEHTLAAQKLEQARANAAQAREELKLARAQLQQRTIRSPLDGVVAERYMAPGQRVQDAPILKIVAIDPLKVDVVVPARYYNRLKPGQRMRIRPELGDATTRDARITIVDRFIDAASNTFRVTLALPNPDHAIPPGARCSAHLAPPDPGAAEDDGFEPQAGRSTGATNRAVASDHGSRAQQPTYKLIIDDKEYDPASNPFIQ